MDLFEFFKKHNGDFGELIRVLRLSESEEEADRTAAARRWAKLCLQFHSVESQNFAGLVAVAALINEKPPQRFFELCSTVFKSSLKAAILELKGRTEECSVMLRG